MKKIVLSAVFLILILLVTAAVWWWWRPQVITFDDGSKLTLLAVQYGKHHEPPLVNGARRGRPMNSTNDTLVVWVHVQSDSGQWSSYQFYAYDKAKTACASAEGGAGFNGKVNQVVGVRLDAFPRRQSHFILRVQEQGNGGPEMADKSFLIHHAVGDYPMMAPETLPDTEEDRDVSVTLTKLTAGVNAPYTRDNDDPNDPMNKGVEATFEVTRNGQSVTNWQPVAVQTTDATGNQLDGQVENNQWQGNDDTVQYQFGLWPDEPAWKMRFEFSQQSGFAPQELWTLPNLPVEPGKMNDFYNSMYNRRKGQAEAAYAETDLNGYHLKVFPAKQFTDMGPNSQPQGGVIIQVTPALAANMRLTISKLTDGQGNDIGFWENSWSPARGMTMDQCQLRDLGDATNVDLTIALHESRFVEFTAKPALAPPADTAQ